MWGKTGNENYAAYLKDTGKPKPTIDFTNNRSTVLYVWPKPDVVNCFL